MTVFTKKNCSQTDQFLPGNESEAKSCQKSTLEISEAFLLLQFKFKFCFSKLKVSPPIRRIFPLSADTRQQNFKQSDTYFSLRPIVFPYFSVRENFEKRAKYEYIGHYCDFLSRSFPPVGSKLKELAEAQ